MAEHEHVAFPPLLSRVIHTRPPQLDLRTPAESTKPTRLVALDDVKLRGTGVAQLLTFVNRRYGIAGWEAFLSALDAESRAIIEEPLVATNWYPFRSCQKYIDGLVALADGRPAVLRDFSIDTLDYATNVVFRAIFKIGSPEFMVARSDQVWKKLYSHGRMICEVRPQKARVELHDFPFLTVNYARIITHSIEAVLLKAGAQVKRAEQTRSTLDGDTLSEFTYEWT